MVLMPCLRNGCALEDTLCPEMLMRVQCKLPSTYPPYSHDNVASGVRVSENTDEGRAKKGTRMLRQRDLGCVARDERAFAVGPGGELVVDLALFALWPLTFG